MLFQKVSDVAQADVVETDLIYGEIFWNECASSGSVALIVRFDEKWRLFTNLLCWFWLARNISTDMLLLKFSRLTESLIAFATAPKSCFLCYHRVFCCCCRNTAPQAFGFSPKTRAGRAAFPLSVSAVSNRELRVVHDHSRLPWRSWLVDISIVPQLDQGFPSQIPARAARYRCRPCLLAFLLAFA